MWAVLTLSLDLPHTRPGGAPSLRQLRLPPAGGASLRVFLIGLTGRQPRRSAVWRSKHRNCAEKKKIKRGNQMSSDCAFREEERGECSLQTNRRDLMQIELSLQLRVRVPIVCYPSNRRSDLDRGSVQAGAARCQTGGQCGAPPARLPTLCSLRKVQRLINLDSVC